MRSIRTKITLCLILTVLAGLAVSGSFSIALNYDSTMSTVEQMMSETAVLAAGRVQQELTAYKNVVIEVGCIPQLSDRMFRQKRNRRSLTGAPPCTISRGEILLAQTVSAFLTAKIIPTGSMCARLCREMFLYQSR